MILDYLKARAVKDIYPFHMPGHKGNSDYFRDIDHILMDITEVRGSDNLRQPSGIIKDAEDMLAKAYGASRSLICVNGSSAGMLAAMLYAACDGEKVVVARNSHVSVHSGLALSGALPVFVYPSVTPYGFAGGLSPSAVEEALAANGDVRAVFITSPTYEGLCSDVAAIARTARSHGALLIVDEAHGAHFGLHTDFPGSSTVHADIVVQSLHKTMVAPNQAAVIHAGPNIDAERLKACLNMVQTTSPSYIIMAMIERCAAIASDPADFQRYARVVGSFRASLAMLENIRLVGSDIRGSYDVHDIDAGKLVFLARRGGGQDIYRYLLEQHRLELEMYGLSHAVAMTSIADTEAGFSRLYYALRELDRKLASHAEAPTDITDIYAIGSVIPKHSATAISPRLAQLRPSHPCGLDEAAGRICASPVTPYPPGIPLLLPGEIIEESTIHHLKKLAHRDIMIDGIFDGKVKVVRDGNRN
ncbi:MAG: aminotransferase class I/II-fold pyridoxal phosphate-dependent enzyme [Defluviitaleaceae bacterium]|nr:aminotransferase class I/II-fold pyridoxal phosphate-dependent enzyme [Defluviitaleaceae bacterium]